MNDAPAGGRLIAQGYEPGGPATAVPYLESTAGAPPKCLSVAGVRP